LRTHVIIYAKTDEEGHMMFPILVLDEGRNALELNYYWSYTFLIQQSFL